MFLDSIIRKILFAVLCGLSCLLSLKSKNIRAGNAESNSPLSICQPMVVGV